MLRCFFTTHMFYYCGIVVYYYFSILFGNDADPASYDICYFSDSISLSGPTRAFHPSTLHFFGSPLLTHDKPAHDQLLVN